MSTLLKVDPSTRRHFGVDGTLMLLWERDCSHCGAREGLLCVVTVCGNPQCQCSEVFVEATLVNEALIAAELGDETVRSYWRPDCKPPPKRRAMAGVELRDGSARIATSARRGARSRDILARLQREIDEELLEHLRSLWRARKGGLAETPKPAAQAPPATAAVQSTEPDHYGTTPTATGRPGRNQPCPCGSGKKFKRCCMSTQSRQESSSMSHLRLVKPSDSAPSFFSYENRMGDRYYLHEGQTKTGKKRYFMARTVRAGALAQVPDGYEVTESINGVVSVKRKTPGEVKLPAADMSLVQVALGGQRHLRWFKAQAVGGAIVIFEPHPRPEELRSLSRQFGIPGRFERFVEERMQKAKYAPVMKFEMERARYVVYRMTYRGHGGWSYPLAAGKLPDLVKKFLPSVGTEKFFDLM